MRRRRPTRRPPPGRVASRRAALVLQACVRGWLQRRRYRLLVARQRRRRRLAAVRVQAAYRGRLARIEFAFLKAAARSNEAHKYARALQCAARAWLARRRVRRLRAERAQWAARRRTRASQVIQSKYRALQASREAAARRRLWRAARTIQRCFRAHRCRVVFLSQLRALRRVQALARGFRDRQFVRRKRQMLHWAEVRHQQRELARAVRLRTQASRMRRRAQEGAERTRRQEALHRRQRAVLRIQSLWRGVRARRHYAYLARRHLALRAAQQLDDASAAAVGFVRPIRVRGGADRHDVAARELQRRVAAVSGDAADGAAADEADTDADDRRARREAHFHVFGPHHACNGARGTLEVAVALPDRAGAVGAARKRAAANRRVGNEDQGRESGIEMTLLVSSPELELPQRSFPVWWLPPRVEVVCVDFVVPDELISEFAHCAFQLVCDGDVVSTGVCSVAVVARRDPPLGAVAAMAVTTTAVEAALREGSRALVVATDAFASAKLRGDPDALANAARVEAALRAQGYRVARLLGENATRANLRTVMSLLRGHPGAERRGRMVVSLGLAAVEVGGASSGTGQTLLRTYEESPRRGKDAADDSGWLTLSMLKAWGLASLTRHCVFVLHSQRRMGGAFAAHDDPPSPDRRQRHQQQHARRAPSVVSSSASAATLVVGGAAAAIGGAGGQPQVAAHGSVEVVSIGRPGPAALVDELCRAVRGEACPAGGTRCTTPQIAAFCAAQAGVAVPAGVVPASGLGPLPPALQREQGWRPKGKAPPLIGGASGIRHVDEEQLQMVFPMLPSEKRRRARLAAELRARRLAAATAIQRAWRASVRRRRSRLGRDAEAARFQADYLYAELFDAEEEVEALQNALEELPAAPAAAAAAAAAAGGVVLPSPRGGCKAGAPALAGDPEELHLLLLAQEQELRQLEAENAELAAAVKQLPWGPESPPADSSPAPSRSENSETSESSESESESGSEPESDSEPEPEAQTATRLVRLDEDEDEDEPEPEDQTQTQTRLVRLDEDEPAPQLTIVPSDAFAPVKPAASAIEALGEQLRAPPPAGGPRSPVTGVPRGETQPMGQLCIADVLAGKPHRAPTRPKRRRRPRKRASAPHRFGDPDTQARMDRIRQQRRLRVLHNVNMPQFTRTGRAQMRRERAARADRERVQAETRAAQHELLSEVDREEGSRPPELVVDPGAVAPGVQVHDGAAAVSRSAVIGVDVMLQLWDGVIDSPMQVMADLPSLGTPTAALVPTQELRPHMRKRKATIVETLFRFS